MPLAEQCAAWGNFCRSGLILLFEHIADGSGFMVRKMRQNEGKLRVRRDFLFHGSGAQMLEL
jgi:hypothetical protein